MTAQDTGIWQTAWLENDLEINNFYREARHKARIRHDEKVFGLRENNQLIALVRIHAKHTYTLLRSLLVAKDARNKGVGHNIITTLTTQLTDCYCLAQPGPALFYQKCGFTLLPSAEYPAGLTDYFARQQRKDPSLVALRFHYVLRRQLNTEQKMSP